MWNFRWHRNTLMSDSYYWLVNLDIGQNEGNPFKSIVEIRHRGGKNDKGTLKNLLKDSIMEKRGYE